MKVIRATHLGMCFGVRDAIALAKHTARHQPVTVLGELVHNADVLRDLAVHSVGFTNDPRTVSSGSIMISAHGASDRKLELARSTGLQVMESTCPLVRHAHRELRTLLVAGYHPVIIGRRGHVEVNGLTEDLADCDVVLTEEDVVALQERPRFGVIAQTTQPDARVNALLRLIRRRFPDSDIQFRDTVCRPTKERQSAAVELARQADVVVVIGGANSNNTHELVATCSRHCERVHHVQNATDIRRAWFQAEDVVGITAGTSTPDTTIDQVEATIRSLHPPAPATTQPTEESFSDQTA